MQRSTLARRRFLKALASSVAIAIGGRRAAAQDARSQEAAKLLKEIESALAKMKEEFGPNPFDDRGPAELTGPHGTETRGNAWARVLASVGVPTTPTGREELAKTIGLDPSASLALAGPMANLDAIEYLTRALKKISAAPTSK